MKRQGLRALAVALAAGGVIATAGCGNLTPTQGAVPNTLNRPHLTLSDFAAVVDAATLRAGSVHTVRVETVEGTKTTYTGDTSFAQGYLGRIQMRMPTGTFGKDSPANQAELRMVRGVAYVYVPGRVPVGKFLVGPKGSRLSTLCSCLFRELEPRTMLKNMRRSLTTVKYLGLEAKGGRYLDHYRLVADMTKVPGGAAAMGRTRTYDIWLDSEHLMHRMTYSSPSFTVDATYSAWGKRVDVDQPAPKQVVTSPLA